MVVDLPSSATTPVACFPRALDAAQLPTMPWGDDHVQSIQWGRGVLLLTCYQLLAAKAAKVLEILRGCRLDG